MTKQTIEMLEKTSSMLELTRDNRDLQDHPDVVENIMDAIATINHAVNHEEDTAD